MSVDAEGNDVINSSSDPVHADMNREAEYGPMYGSELQWPVRCFTCNRIMCQTERLNLFEELQEVYPPMPMHLILDEIGMKGHAKECCRIVALTTVPTDIRRPIVAGARSAPVYTVDDDSNNESTEAAAVEEEEEEEMNDRVRHPEHY